MGHYADAPRSSERNRLAAAPAARQEITGFGSFRVIPDGADPSTVHGGFGAVVTQSEFAERQQDYNAVLNGSGNLRVSEETDPSQGWGGQHTDTNAFRDRTMSEIAELSSQPGGRHLVHDLIHGEHTTTIQANPVGSREVGGAHNHAVDAHGAATRGVGSDSMVHVDTDAGDDDVVVAGARGQAIRDPRYIRLGHELVHAHHNNLGQNRGHEAAHVNAYPNGEEEATIAEQRNGGAHDVTENIIRAEHGLPLREGHEGTDRRFPS